uniref:CSON004385 protein n=1 Tax=Culicoides sonorensis TaxID=179676 RepID=A0A336LTE3_CULSO
MDQTFSWLYLKNDVVPFYKCTTSMPNDENKVIINYLKCHGKSPFIPIPRFRQAATIKLNFTLGIKFYQLSMVLAADKNLTINKGLKEMK